MSDKPISPAPAGAQDDLEKHLAQAQEEMQKLEQRFADAEDLLDDEPMDGQIASSKSASVNPQGFADAIRSQLVGTQPPAREAKPAVMAAPAPVPAAGRNMGLLMDVPLAVTVELGRTRMTVQQVLELERGSVIELDRIAGEAVDVFVNDRLIAHGEVVVVDDKFGVRITKIVSDSDQVTM